jgi:nitrite reductase (NO-forming)
MTGFDQAMGRRSLLKRLAALGLAAPVAGALGACSDDSNGSPAGPLAADAASKTEPEGQPAGAEAAPAAQQPAPPQPVDLAFLPNPQVPPPITRATQEVVKVDLEIQEIDGKLADGVGYNFWTFNGTIPGPMIRVRQGDHVELTLGNSIKNKLAHNIDLHAVTGPGGGAALSNVGVGQTKSFRFKALHPGVFIYHCATAPIDLHISNGLHGLIVVEPPEGLGPVNKEFYVSQSEIYTPDAAGTPGMQSFDMERMLNEDPSYVVFNGAMGSLVGDRALKAAVGDEVRMFFGVGGPNLASSFHVIGEIFNRAATSGSLTSLAENVQTISVPPGAATMLEFDVQVPGTYLLVDHALSRLRKGAAGHLVVEGEDNPDIYAPVS